MRQHFFGYYEMTPDQFKKLWRDCIFVVDTNVLLDMYRMSPSAQETLFQTLAALKDRLWIPYQVACEYHRNVTTVILDQIKNCKDVIGDSNQWVNKIIEGCKSKRNYPYLSEDLQQRIMQVAEDIKQEIEGERQDLEMLINSNPTKDKIADLLDGRLWNKLQDTRLENIYQEGKKRYDLKIPPGYGDLKNNKKGVDVYGDLVVWEEIIAYALANKKDVIFVTSDTNKEDWFIKVGEKVLGPRAELRMEFYERTNQTYYAYSTAVFLQYVGDYIEIPKISDKVIEEVASIIAEKAELDNSKTDSAQYNSGYTFVTGELEHIDDLSSSES